MEKRSKITASVIGSGKTGLLTACLLAETGYKTLIVDSDHVLASLVKKGKSASSSLELAKLMKKYTKSGGLTLANNVREAASKSAVVIIAHSPLVDEKRKPDYTHLERASKEIGAGLQSGSLVLVEGIIGPGVTETLVKESLQKTSGLKAGIDFSLAVCPISTTSEAFRNAAASTRLVGALDERSLAAACLFLKSLAKSQITTVKNIRTAEAIGIFGSVNEDVNHALSLELARFCEKAGVDFTECQKATSANLPFSLPVSNVAKRYFSPEPYLFFEEAENSGSLLSLVTLARKINEDMLKRTVHMTKEALKSCGKMFRRARITVLGITEHLDPEVLDTHFSRNLVSSLIKNGARVRVYDPLFSVKEIAELGFQVEATLGKAIEGADCLLIAVGHERFRRLNLKRIRFLMKQPAALVDVSNVVDSERAVKEGFVYRGLGRG